MRLETLKCVFEACVSEFYSVINIHSSTVNYNTSCLFDLLQQVHVYQIFNTPVRMHGGLICMLSVCPSVRLFTKIQTRQLSTFREQKQLKKKCTIFFSEILTAPWL